MAHVPLPTLNDLQNRFNSVVRFQTNYGVIDIELFDSTAPITVLNFLGYVTRGDYDGMFFHRLVRNFVLQGGLARLGDNGQPENIFTTPPIQNEFSLSNLERTVAMARIAGQPNSATSQWFINLVDNTTLDAVNGGFAVFGRILGDASWEVVQTIAALPIYSFGTPYNELPVSEDFDPNDGVQYHELVYIIDSCVWRGCTCDWDLNGVITVDDIFAFLSDWFADNADFDQNGVTNANDIFAFLSCWFVAHDTCSD